MSVSPLTSRLRVRGLGRAGWELGGLLLALLTGCAGAPAPPAPVARSTCDEAAARAVAPLLAEGRLRRASARVDALCPAGEGASLRLDLALRLGRFDAARALLDADARALPESIVRAARARIDAAARAPIESADLTLADAALARADGAEAARGFGAAIALDPLDVRALVGAQRAHALAGDAAAARAFGDRAFEALRARVGDLPRPVAIRSTGGSTRVLPTGVRVDVRWPEATGFGRIGRPSAFGRAVYLEAGHAWLADLRHTHARDLGPAISLTSGDGDEALVCSPSARRFVDSAGGVVEGPACPPPSFWLLGRVLERGDGVVETVGGVVLAKGRPLERAWFPRQRRLVVARDAGGVAVVDVRAATVLRAVPGARDARGAGLSDDGARVFVTEGGKLWAVEVASGAQAPRGPAPRGLEAVGELPDGRLCARVSQGRRLATNAGRLPLFEEPFEHRILGARHAARAGWEETCVLADDGRARRVLRPAREPPRSGARILHWPGEHMTPVLNGVEGYAVSEDARWAAWVSRGRAGWEAVVLATGDEPRVALRVALSSPEERLSFDGERVVIGGDPHPLPGAAPAPPAAPPAPAPAGPRLLSGSADLAALFEPPLEGTTPRLHLGAPVLVLTDGREIHVHRGGAEILVGARGPASGALFFAGGKVEIVGGASDGLACRAGDVLVPFDVCRDDAEEPGLAARVLVGAP